MIYWGASNNTLQVEKGNKKIVSLQMLIDKLKLIFLHLPSKELKVKDISNLFCVSFLFSNVCILVKDPGLRFMTPDYVGVVFN